MRSDPSDLGPTSSTSDLPLRELQRLRFHLLLERRRREHRDELLTHLHGRGYLR